MLDDNKTSPDKDNMIRITMLGSFEIRSGGQSIGDSENRSHQLWRMLEYLVAYRHRDISQNEIIETLWPEDEIGNPAGALKNLVYRIRGLLEKADLPHAKEMLLFHRDTYCWNNKLNTVVDCEEFEASIQQAENTQLPTQQRITAYLTAIRLYKGDFLPKSSCELWVLPLSSYYRELYIKAVHTVTALLHQMEHYPQVVSICEAAVLIDPFDEGIHKALIRAYIGMGEPQKAMAHYEYVTTLFYNELAVKPSDSLRDLYREIIKNTSHVEADLNIVKEDLCEENDSASNGAFVCEYEVFKGVYRLVARSAARSGQAVFVGMITLSGTPQQPVTQKYLVSGMELLQAAITGSLRRGDAVSRFSPTQYVLMLPTLTFENGQEVLNRIVHRFRRENPRFPLEVSCVLQPIDPLWL